MRVVVITPPAAVVTWAEADAHLRLDGDTSQQAYVESLVAAATAHLDGPTGWLGRALGVQALEARFDDFGCGILRLPFPPIISLTSVRYIDGGGTEQVLDASAYELRGADLGTTWGHSWPSARYQPEAVRVRYLAGYETLPAPIQAAVLLMTADLYENRTTTVTGQAMAIPMSTTVDDLLAPYRVYS